LSNIPLLCITQVRLRNREVTSTRPLAPSSGSGQYEKAWQLHSARGVSLNTTK